MFRIHGIWTLLLCWLLLAGILSANAAGGAAANPVGYVRGVLEEVMAIQSNPSLAGPAHRGERKKLIQELIAGSFAIERMAEKALGEHWQKIDGHQRQEYVAVFRSLFQDSYTRMVLNFLHGERITYSAPKEAGGVPLVQTVIERPSDNVPVNYRLEKGPSGWRIQDVIIDGVSIVDTYRSSFSRIITAKSFQFLLEKLRLQQKAAQEDSPDPQMNQ